MGRDKLVYVSGSYSGSPEEVIKNISTARSYAMEIWELGFTAICPHLNTMHFERDCKCDYEDYMEGDLEIVTRMDAMFMIPGWESSNGALMERSKILLLERPVFYSLKDLNSWRSKKWT